MEEQAKKIYEGICTALDNRKWYYDRDNDRLLVRFTVNGDDIPMKFVMFVEPQQQVVRAMSFLPFKVPEEKRREMAVGVCAINFRLIEGNYDFDMSDGSLCYRITASYRASEIGDGLFQRMISMGCAAVDKYNDRFLALSKGYLTLENFLKLP